MFEIRDLWPESAIDTGVLKNKQIISFAYWFEKFIYKKSKLINVLTPAFRDKLIQDKNIPIQIRLDVSFFSSTSFNSSDSQSIH